MSNETEDKSSQDPTQPESSDEASRSGGVDVNAEQVSAGGDIVGRDKAGGDIVRGDKVTNIHYHIVQQQSVGPGTENARVFISYTHGIDPDEAFAIHLYRVLNERKHQAFLDQKKIKVGMDWAKEIQLQVEGADYFIVLISSNSADSEHIAAELKLAYDRRDLQGKPAILPVRLAYEGGLPYQISSYLERLQYAHWRDETDTEEVVAALVSAIEGSDELPSIGTQLSQSIAGRLIVSADGRVVDVTQSETRSAPLPKFDPRMILEAPRGAVRIKSEFYIERDGDDDIRRQVLGAGTTTTILASRQMGKTSLLVRGVREAREAKQQVVYIDFQRVNRTYLDSLDNLLRYFADEISARLHLETDKVDDVWSSSRGSQDKLTTFMETHVLPKADAPLLLAIDEADRLLERPYKTDFFGLLRAWDSSRAYDELWERLNIALVIATEPHLLITDVSQSPFNVGLRIQLRDFDEAQVADLNERHGSPVKPNELPDLMRLLGGHPFLTRQGLYTMVDQKLSWKEFADIAPTEDGPFGSHLRTYVLLLSQRPELVSGMQEVLLKNSCADEMLLYRLSSAGLVKEVDGQCIPRSELYAEYLGARL